MPFGYPEAPEGIIGQLRRATVTEVDDSGTQQILRKMRGLASERPEDVYRPQAHGFSSHPPTGSEGLFLSLGGRSDRLVGLGFEHKDKRPKNLPEGGVALYDADGKILKIIKDETTFDAGGKPVRIFNATTVSVEGASKIMLKVGGRVVVVQASRIDLGADPAPYKVVTEAGPSSVVYAVKD
jgi:phage baseplate assembly protein V